MNITGKCPCGRKSKAECKRDNTQPTDKVEQKASPSGPASPADNNTTAPTSPTLPDSQSEEAPSYGPLEAQEQETNSPEEILTDAQTHDWDHCFALMSGGYDSLVATHYAMMNAGFPITGIIHIDTNIGLRETTEYVEDMAEEMGIPLYIADERKEKDEFEYRIQHYGFPGATKVSHKWEYVNNKDKPLQKFLQQWGDCLLISGARRPESGARYESVNADGIEVKDNGNIFASPIASWTSNDVEEYMEENGLPESEVVNLLKHSGDCLCGAYADRWFELDVLSEHFPYMHTYIQSLEARVMDRARTSDMKREDYEEYVLWGHGSQDDRERKQRHGEREMTLCRSCEPAIPGTIDGTEFQTLVEAALPLDEDVIPNSSTAFRDAFDVTQAIPDDEDDHDIDMLRDGYTALDEAAGRLGYNDHSEMVKDNLNVTRDSVAQEFGYDSFDELIEDAKNFDSLEELVEQRHAAEAPDKALASWLGTDNIKQLSTQN